jgi:hypothetical protein
MLGEPKNITLPCFETENYILTNIIMWGAETGVWPKANGEMNFDDVYIICHNWENWEEANNFILMCLERKWTCERIEKLMVWMENKGWNEIKKLNEKE